MYLKMADQKTFFLQELRVSWPMTGPVIVLEAVPSFQMSPSSPSNSTVCGALPPTQSRTIAKLSLFTKMKKTTIAQN